MVCATDDELFAGARPTLTALAEGAAFSISTAPPVPPALPGSRALRIGFGQSAAPGGSGKLRASAGRLSADWTYTYERPSVATAIALVRTSRLYLDRSSALHVAYSLTDSTGETRVKLSGLVVQAALSFSTDCAGGSVAGVPSTLACSGTPDVDGVGEAVCTVPKGLFCRAPPGTRVATVHLTARYGAAVAATTHAGTVELTAHAESAQLGSTGMLALLPQSPRFVDDTVDVVVHAHTGPTAFQLHGWSFVVRYDTSVLGLVSRTFSSLYQAPTVSHRASEGVFDVATTGLAASTDDADVTSQQALPLATLTFRVVGTAPTGALTRYASVLTGTVVSMVNQGTQAYLSAAPLLLSDDRTGTHAAGDISIQPSVVMGHLAYWGATERTNSLVNLASLGGATATATVQVLELYSNPLTASVGVSSGSNCSVDAPAIASVGGAPCRVQVTSMHSEGGRVHVSVQAPQGTHGGGTAMQGLVATVWYPVALAVHAVDADLGRLAQCEPGAVTPFQVTRLSAVATFGGGGLTAVSGIDVSDVVQYQSSAPSVVSVAGRVASGVGAGSAEIAVVALTLSSSSAVSAAHVTVTTAPSVSVVEVRAAVVTAVEWSTTGASLPWSPPDASVVASAALVQQLNTEGAVGEVLAYARFSDGTEQMLQAHELHVSALSPSIGTTYSSSEGAWGLTVLPGAVRECGEVVHVSWTACDRNTTAYVTLNLPTATAVHATIAAARLAPSGDAATLPPLTVASSATIHVLVDFDDGTTRDFTDDARVSTQVTTQIACGTVEGTTLTVGAGVPCDLLAVQVTVPALGASLRDTTSVAVVRLDALQASAVPYPSFVGSTGIALTSMGRLDCIAAYQHAQLRVLAMLSDGSSMDVTSAVSAATSSTGLVVAQNSGGAVWRLMPSEPGSKTVDIGLGTHTAVLTLTVLNGAIAISDLTVSASDVRASSSNTFAGMAGDERAVGTKVVFADGTQFDDLYANTLNWFDPRGLVGHSTSDAQSISVAWATVPAHPVVVLHNNSALRVALRAQSECASSVHSELQVAPNLLPAVGDVDLGAVHGLQFQQVGNELTVQVRANSADGWLVNYQVEITFDEHVFYATSCSGGALNGFDCTLNDPFDKVKMLATDTASRLSGSAITLGSFTLQIYSTAVTLVYGTIVELVRKLSNGAVEVRTSDAPISAGSGYAAVSSASGRRLQPDGAPPLALAAARARQPRRLQTSGCYEQTTPSGTCLAGFWCASPRALTLPRAQSPCTWRSLRHGAPRSTPPVA